MNSLNVGEQITCYCNTTDYVHNSQIHIHRVVEIDKTDHFNSRYTSISVNLNTKNNKTKTKQNKIKRTKQQKHKHYYEQTTF